MYIHDCCSPFSYKENIMSDVNLTKCDYCDNTVDNEFESPIYHRLFLGGSGCKMVWGSREPLDFCCVECLIKYIEKI